MSCKRLTLLKVLGLAVLVWPLTAHANLIELQPFFFGDIIIVNNDSVHEYTVDISGNAVTSEHIFLMNEDQKPQPARFKLDSLPEFSEISVRVAETRLEAGNSDNYFTLDNIETVVTYAPEGSSIDITIGATLKTSGNGMSYAGDVYSGFLPISVDY